MLALLVLLYVFTQTPGPKRLVQFRASVAAHLKAILGLAVTIALITTAAPHVTLPDVYHYELTVMVGPFVAAFVISGVVFGLVAAVCVFWLPLKKQSPTTTTPTAYTIPLLPFLFFPLL